LRPTRSTLSHCAELFKKHHVRVVTEGEIEVVWKRLVLWAFGIQNSVVPAKLLAKLKLAFT